MDGLIELLGVTIFLGLGVVFVPLERLLPFHAQPVLRRNWLSDLGFWVFNRPLLVVLGFLYIGAVGAGLGVLLPSGMAGRVAALPLWASVPLALLVADLTFYGVHRAAHAIPALWQFHAVHHSIEKLDWLAGVRVHPLDQLLTTISGIALQLALGFSVQTLAITGTLYLWQSHFVHSNLRVPMGPLRWVLAGPGFHHWHHSDQPEAQNKNFSGQLPFLDRLFGTAYFPDGEFSRTYGIPDPVPVAYPSAFLYPFRRLARMARGLSLEPEKSDLPLARSSDQSPGERANFSRNGGTK